MREEHSTISTHVLDTGQGRPAAGVAVTLFRVLEGSERVIGGGTTNDDGRISSLLGEPLEAGDYRIEFRLDGPFFRSAGASFRIEDTGRSYHVPLLLAPYSVASYLGS